MTNTNTQIKKQTITNKQHTMKIEEQRMINNNNQETKTIHNKQ